MNRIAKFCFAVLACALCAQAAADDGMYKCKDAAGKITYAGRECHLLGLTSAGEVTGRASVTPAPDFPPPPPAVTTPRPRVQESAPVAAEQPAAGEEAVVGQDGRRCFKTAKGMRCNDSTD